MALNSRIVSNRICSVCIIMVVLLGGSVLTVYGKIVTTNNGQIEGFSQTVQINNEQVYVDTYLGIPFATPPLGDLRFRAPQEVKNWTGIKPTKTQPNCCMQSPDTNFDRFYGVEMWNCNTKVSEDCLYLNLWVPRSRDGSKLSTMVWIYGGSFTYGSITLDVYDGTYLALMENVIVASMQYRMGVHGFLYTGTEGAPGNVGLRDQQMAMKWIYNNIEHFGGDKSKITLFGESAGSASVSYHLILPSSMPYFTNGIMQSATFFANWAVNSPDNVLDKSRTLAKLLNCDDDDMNELLDCLKQVDAMELENKQWLLNETNVGIFGIVVDGEFFPNYPTYQLSSGNFKDSDILLGVTKDEGEYFLVYHYQDIILPSNLWNRAPLDRSEYVEIMSRISGYETGVGLDLFLYVYETSKLPSNRGLYWDILDDMYGDHKFKCSIRDLALWHSQHRSNRNTFVYRFDYINSNNPWPSYMGSLHGYEIESIFGIPFNLKYNYSENDRKVSADVMHYFATFAKTGNVNNPTSDLTVWPKFTADSEEFLVINRNNYTAEKGFRTKECTFWSDVVPKLSKFNSGSKNNGDTSGSGYRSASGFIHLFAILFVVFFNRFV